MFTMLNHDYHTNNISRKSLQILKKIFIILLSYALICISINSGSVSFLLYSLPLLSLLISFKNKSRIKIPFFLILLFIPSVLFISLNELILQNNIVNPHPSNYYLFLLFLVFIPYIVKEINLKIDDLILPTIIFTIISLIFNSYMNFIFEFDRNKLAEALNPIIIYNYANIIITFIPLLYTLHKNKSKKSIFIIILCFLNIFSICMQGSRGIWLGLVVILLFSIIKNYKKYKKQIISIISIILIFSIAYLSIFPNNPINQRIKDAQSDYSAINSNKFKSTSIGQRHVMYETTIEQFIKSPIYGVGNRELVHQVSLKNNIKPPHTHSLFLHELGSHGLLGLMGILSLLIYPIYLSCQNKKLGNIYQKSNILNNLIYIICIFTIICGLTDYTFSFKFSLYIYNFIIAILLSLEIDSKINES